jgi:uncharacterized membrane protein
MNYDEIQPNSELRAYARMQLKGVWGKMAFTFFVIFLIQLPYSVVSGLDTIQKKLYDGDSSFSFTKIFLTIAALVLIGPFALGLAGYFLKRIRGEQIRLQNIFDGFSRFLQSFLKKIRSLRPVCRNI